MNTFTKICLGLLICVGSALSAASNSQRDREKQTLEQARTQDLSTYDLAYVQKIVEYANDAQDYEMIKKCLSIPQFAGKFKVNRLATWDSLSPLIHRAVETDDAELVTLLIANGADVNTQDRDDYKTPLFYAKSVAVAQLLLDAGADPDAQARNGKNVYSAEKGYNPHALYSSSATYDKPLTDVQRYILEFSQKETPNAKLSHAIKRKNFARIEALIDQHTKGEIVLDINTVDQDGNTALHVAAIAQRIDLNQPTDLFRKICALNPNLEIVNNAGNTPLLCTMQYERSHQYGEQEPSRGFFMLSALLRQGANPNSTNATTGETPLIAAARQRNTVAIATLVGTPNIEVNAQTKEGWSALAYAASQDGENGSSAVSEAMQIAHGLLEHGANPNTIVPGRAKNSVLLHAVANTRAELFTALVDKGADVTYRNDYNEDARRFIRAHDVNITTRLNTEIQTLEQELRDAIDRGDIERIKKFTPSQLALNATALHDAIKANKLTVAKALIDAGVSIKNTDADRNTPLHLAITHDNVDLIEHLRQKDPYLCSSVSNNSDGKTFIDLAYERNNPDVIRALKIDTPLHKAVREGKVEEVTRLLQDEAKNKYLNAQNHCSQTPLHVAVEHTAFGLDNCAMTQLLLDAGADHDVRDSRERTPLHYAVEHWDPKLTQMLLARGAQHDVRDNFGNTPLHCAAQRSSLEAAQFLLAAGANPDAKNSNDQTPDAMPTSFENDNLKAIRQACVAKRTTQKNAQPSVATPQQPGSTSTASATPQPQSPTTSMATPPQQSNRQPNSTTTPASQPTSTSGNTAPGNSSTSSSSTGSPSGQSSSSSVDSTTLATLFGMNKNVVRAGLLVPLVISALKGKVAFTAAQKFVKNQHEIAMKNDPSMRPLNSFELNKAALVHLCKEHPLLITSVVGLVLGECATFCI